MDRARPSLTTGPAVLYALLWVQAGLWAMFALGVFAASAVRARYGASPGTVADLLLVAAVAVALLPAVLALRFRYLSGRSALVAYQVLASALTFGTQSVAGAVLVTLGWVFLIRDDTKAFFAPETATRAMP